MVALIPSVTGYVSLGAAVLLGRWMALVPLAGLVLVPFVVETRRFSAAAPGSAAR